MTKTTGKYKLDAAGMVVPCDDLIEWARWFETADRILEQTEVGGAEVSTVFLSFDHEWRTGKPLLWETLVFGGPMDGTMFRYETRVQAKRGHDEMVANVRKAMMLAEPQPGDRQIQLEDE